MTAVRIHRIFMGLFILIGIYLTGLDKVHWLLFVPVIMSLFAGITGICPGTKMLKKFGLK